MKKKVYQHPMMHIVTIQQAQLICASGDGKKVEKLDSNVDFIIGGGGDGPAHAPEEEDFEDEEDW